MLESLWDAENDEQFDEALDKLTAHALLQPISIMGDQGRSGHAPANVQMDFICNKATLEIVEHAVARMSLYLGHLKVLKSGLGRKAGGKYLAMGRCGLVSCWAEVEKRLGFTALEAYAESIRAYRSSGPLATLIVHQLWGGRHWPWCRQGRLGLTVPFASPSPLHLPAPWPPSLDTEERSACPSLAMAQRVFGPRHPAVAAEQNVLALFLMAHGRHREAEGCYRQSIEGLERTLGPYSPVLASGLNNLAILLHLEDRLG
ncbi:unnamed protein product [Discosporangium mesarthrocarpum]